MKTCANLSGTRTVGESTSPSISPVPSHCPQSWATLQSMQVHSPVPPHAQHSSIPFSFAGTCGIESRTACNANADRCLSPSLSGNKYATLVLSLRMNREYLTSSPLSKTITCQFVAPTHPSQFHGFINSGRKSSLETNIESISSRVLIPSPVSCVHPTGTPVVRVLHHHSKGQCYTRKNISRNLSSRLRPASSPVFFSIALCPSCARECFRT